ncbi:MAG TPA: AAA family ATPase [Edaphobacter sp.]|uniref:AAA family ATPase n=1 Tax=Edaphobacter sp. TaxID=1934404 RepID=UPI002D07DA8C|nr:AAA family ATPase [Edaphobacter sp.]HUZ94699.1 AAA family ATPase [Edaphobacter sp.]
MKIRSVQVTNFRKFVGTVRVDGITDGVNLLVGQNELGKSTLLEAINGVIFEKAKSQTELVRSFRHFVNGTVPEVELAFNLDGTSWTIRKRFAGQAGKAVLTSSDRRRFEDEAAETELQRLLEFASRRGGGEPGIWGTLWVRQGRSFGDAKLDDAGRRTLQGCIEAQVGVVTGGERGRKIPIAIEQALGEMISTRGPRGKFKDAKDRLAETEVRVNQLGEKRREIFDYMDILARLKRERKDLQVDWNEETHRRELDEARTRRTAAATKAAEIEAARNAAKLAEERAARERTAVTNRAELAREVALIEAEIKGLRDEIGRAEIYRNETNLLVETCEKRLADLRDQARLAGEQSRRLERIRSVSSLRTEIEQHEATLAKAADLQAAADRLSELIGQITATDEAVLRIEAADTELSGAKAALSAVATTVSLAIETVALGRVRLDGAPLDTPAISLAIVAKTTIGVEGVGEIVVEPQIDDRDAILERLRLAENTLMAALETARAENLTAARHALAERRELERQLAEVRRGIAGLAPRDPSTKLAAGLDARQTRVSELRGRLKTELDGLTLSALPTAAEIAKEIAETHDRAEQLAIDIQAAEAALDGPKGVLVEASTTLQEHEHRLAGRQGTLESKQAALAAGRAQSSDEELSAHATALTLRANEQQTALTTLENSQGETVEAIDIRIKRLETAGRNHQDALATLNNEITRLTTLIEASEGAGVEEALEIAKAEQARLEAAVKGYEEEAAVLQLLQQALREAEREAKALYLAPVVSRVQPYLRMLLPGTNLVLDENLSISAIERNGAAEEFGRLSEGTQEQLAVLTRLAFAELLLKQGRPATVILDDALAFSDDQRIERMFDILMRAGESVQIIVLTCRKRLFARLGATTLEIQERKVE